MEKLTSNIIETNKQGSPINDNTNKANKTSIHPLWATKFRAPGKELRYINGKYYLYECSTVYDPIKKRTKKISGKLLGSITQDKGFIESSKNLLRKQAQKQVEQQSSQQQDLKSKENKTNIQVGTSKEFGFSQYILDHLQNISQHLQKHFSDAYKHILLLVYCRLLNQSPIKNMPYLMEQSWLAHYYQTPILGTKKISNLLTDIGKNRERVSAYMRDFMCEKDYFLVDMTHIPTKSTKIDLAKKGYNNKGDYDPQVHILYLYGATSQMPAFYRLQAGNIREIKSFKLTILESGIKNSIIIGDKGFYSKANQTTRQKFLFDPNIDKPLPVKAPIFCSR